ncbi:MAG TPA: hypothetical protein VI818_03215 [Candidatus Thermoplasmatota archaeon]|nr:hypothetical protein [Candidatus Thermoplasmatota archaeon]
MHGSAVLAVVLVLGAGCSTPAETTDADGAEKRPRLVGGALSALDFVNETLVNKTLKYPRLGSGNHHRVDFNVSSGSRTFFMEWQSLLECPAGQSRDMKFSLTDPSGTQAEYWLAHGSGSPGSSFGWLCEADPLASHTPSPTSRMVREPLPGLWILRTLGDCMCSSRFLVKVESPTVLG